MSRLDILIRIYRSLDTKQTEGAVREGVVTVTDNTELDLLKCASDEEFSTKVGLVLLSEVSEVEAGKPIRVRLFPPKELPIYQTQKDLLQRLQIGPVNHFYVVEEDWWSADDKGEDFDRITRLSDFIEQLKLCAAVFDTSTRTLFFTDKHGVVEVPIQVPSEALSTLDARSIADFVTFCSDSLHSEHRRKSVTTVVGRVARGVEITERFGYLLADVRQLVAEAKSDHAVFLSAFSYDKVRDEVENVRVEYTAKIHKVLSEIQGQLLGIPAAGVVVATQLSAVEEPGSALLSNLAILLGAWVFGVFMILLLKNQTHTIDVIRDEVERQREQLTAKLPDVSANFKKVFSSLNQRIKHQQKILFAVDAVVVLGLVLSSIAFWVLSGDACKLLWMNLTT